MCACVCVCVRSLFGSGGAAHEKPTMSKALQHDNTMLSTLSRTIRTTTPEHFSAAWGCQLSPHAPAHFAVHICNTNFTESSYIQSSLRYIGYTTPKKRQCGAAAEPAFEPTCPIRILVYTSVIHIAIYTSMSDAPGGTSCVTMCQLPSPP